MNKAASGAAQCEGGTDHQGKADLLREFLSFEIGVGRLCLGYRHAELDHPLPEFFPVFRLVDGFDVDADQPHVYISPRCRGLRLLWRG